MQLNELTPQYKPKRKKRIGRGGKRGTYCGKGIKGQNSRAGAKIRPAIRDMIKKIPKQTWLNDRNQFLIPSTAPTKEFLNDCVVWSLFASSNETTALKNVSYLGSTYQIKNNFYPFRLEEIKNWEDFGQSITKLAQEKTI